MARKASGTVEEAESVAERPYDDVYADGGGAAAATEVRAPAPTFDGAYSEYFRSVCRGQRAQQVEMQRVWCDYVRAMQAAIVTHDSNGALRAQNSFHQEWARVADPARFQESVRDAFDAYQQKISHAFAATDLTRLPPGALEAIGRSVSHVAAHRMGIGG